MCRRVKPNDLDKQDDLDVPDDPEDLNDLDMPKDG